MTGTDQSSRQNSVILFIVTAIVAFIVGYWINENQYIESFRLNAALATVFVTLLLASIIGWIAARLQKDWKKAFIITGIIVLTTQIIPKVYRDRKGIPAEPRWSHDRRL